MGQFYSDSVEKALQYVYYENRGRAVHGQEGLKLLMDASAAGDGDASCVLARCLCGYQYVWSGFGFPEDDEKAEALYRKSVEQGSALGMLVALRSGQLSKGLERKAPMTLQEAFEKVRKNAAGGDAFSQFVIGNCYFWWDFLRIQGKSADSFSSREEFKAYLKENITQCEDWFWKAFRGGMYLAGNNLNHYYENGDEDIVPPQPEKAKEIFKIGAEIGYPLHQYFYAKELEDAGNLEEARKWYRKSADNGGTGVWYKLGEWYTNGTGGPADEAEARYCFEQSAARHEIGGLNELGEWYYLGLHGYPKDPAKAFAYFEEAHSKGNNFSLPYLSRCYLEGWGTAPDYQKAYDMAWESKDRSGFNDGYYVLGRLYCEGLGVPEDIAKGVGFFLRVSARMPEAAEELKKYKRGLFGGWKRR